jgi:anti-sigma factor RsiW
VTVPHPQDELPGLLRGELPPATAVAVDRHLAGCDPCRRDLAAVAVAASALRDVARLPMVAAVDLPPLRPLGPQPRQSPTRLIVGPLNGRVAQRRERRRRVSTAPPSSTPRDRRRRARWLLGAAAVLVALLLGIGGLTVGRDRDTGRGQTVALGAPAGGGATAEARMRGAGDEQIMTITARGLPRPPAGGHYEVWLVGDPGEELAVGVLAPGGEGVWSLPAEVAARYRTIDVTLESADGNPARSGRSVLRGSYA